MAVNYPPVLYRRFFLLGLLLIAPGFLWAVPIQGAAVQGSHAAQARLRLLAAAESCLGVPYRYAGLDRNGLDCSGLVYLSVREGLNYTAPRSTEGLYAWVEKIETRDLQLGDLVFFVTTGRRVSHVGIYAEDGWFINAASDGPRTGVIYSRLDESYWSRTYLGAGRILPWDEEAAAVMAAALAAGKNEGAKTAAANGVPSRPGGNAGAGFAGLSAARSSSPPPAWKDPGFFAGLGAAWTWGGFIEGAPSPFRGVSALAALGYKWTNYRASLELRPEWDRALGVFRIPFTLALGTDNFQVFAGPAYTFGEPGLSLSGGERPYTGGGAWLGEAGFSTAFPTVRFGRGALSLYGEFAWQFYHRDDAESFSPKPDITANIRLSTGVRYLWRL